MPNVVVNKEYIIVDAIYEDVGVEVGGLYGVYGY